MEKVYAKYALCRGDLRQAIDGWVMPTLTAVDGAHPGMVAGARKYARHRWKVVDLCTFSCCAADSKCMILQARRSGPSAIKSDFPGG